MSDDADVLVRIYSLTFWGWVLAMYINKLQMCWCNSVFTGWPASKAV